MRKILCVLLLLVAFNLQAQKQEVNPSDYSNQSVEMADKMRQEGKIYVVVAVIAVLFIGLSGYMVLIDRKISRLEKELKK